MYTDARGLEWSTDNPDAGQALATLPDRYAGFKADVGERVKAALAADPEAAMANVWRGYLMMLMGHAGLVPKAQQALDAATPLLEGATPREREHAEVLNAWIRGEVRETARRLESIAARWPKDLLALRMAHQFSFWLGERQRLRDVVGRALPHWEESTPGYHYLLGMQAFGLEECGQYAEAEAAGRKGVELNPEDHWCTHAVGHVLEMQGRHREGIAWMDGLQQYWGGCNDFINHLWWHRSLYHLELGQFDAVLGIYDEHIRTGRLDFHVVMHNAASLLWRLELYGVEVGDRWEQIAEFSAQRISDHTNPFNDMHYTMALAGAGRGADVQAHLTSLREDAIRRSGTWSDVFRDVTVPLCDALATFRAGKPGEAIAGLQTVQNGLYRAGGSHAQRDVVQETLIAAALADRRFDLARDLLADRTAQKPTSAWSWRHYAEVLEASDDTVAAEDARARADALLNAA